MSAHPHAQDRAGAAASSGGTEHPQAGPRTYVLIAVVLLVLTIMEVAVFYVPALQKDPRILIPVLIVLALAKFSLVAMFYMHLRFDHVWFSYLFIAPLVIMTGLALALLWLFHVFGSTGVRPTTGG